MMFGSTREKMENEPDHEGEEGEIWWVGLGSLG